MSHILKNQYMPMIQRQREPQNDMSIYIPYPQLIFYEERPNREAYFAFHLPREAKDRDRYIPFEYDYQLFLSTNYHGVIPTDAPDKYYKPVHSALPSFLAKQF